ncbi:MAG: ABC transporter permease [Candidatus Micrarchaeota archaeon]|nr:ABC transporter permease [Candidatus Micrarchaeota archaeon]
MNAEYLRLAFTHLRHRPTRTLLTMIGIFIGIASVVALVSLGQGLQNAIEDQFKSLGANKIMVMPGGGGMGVMGMFTSSVEMTEEDLETVKRTQGIKMAVGMITKTGILEFGDEKKGTFVIGLPVDEDGRKLVEGMTSIKVAHGRLGREGDRYKMVVGYSLARTENSFFKKPVKVGDRIGLLGRNFDVVGTLETIGNPADDSQVYIPIETAKEVFNTEEYIIIYAESREGLDTTNVAEAVSEELRRRHGVKEGEEDFSVQTIEQLKSSSLNILLIVQAIVLTIAAVSLVVGGVGIMNTMYTAVLERTREIGIMKAIGATNEDIMWIFLVESGLLGMVGGLIGVTLGAAVSKGVEAVAVQALQTTLLQVWLPPELIVGTLMFSFAIGAVSGVLPARQAAMLKPVEALRYE